MIKKKRKIHPNSLKNLKIIKKGEVRNKKGKQKKIQDWSTIVKNLLDEVDNFTIEDEEQRKIILRNTNRYIICYRLMQRAKRADLNAIRLLFEIEHDTINHININNTNLSENVTFKVEAVQSLKENNNTNKKTNDDNVVDI